MAGRWIECLVQNCSKKRPHQYLNRCCRFSYICAWTGRYDPPPLSATTTTYAPPEYSRVMEIKDIKLRPRDKNGGFISYRDYTLPKPKPSIEYIHEWANTIQTPMQFTGFEIRQSIQPYYKGTSELTGKKLGTDLTRVPYITKKQTKKGVVYTIDKNVPV